MLAGCLFESPFGWVGPAIHMEQRVNGWWVALISPTGKTAWFGVENVKVLRRQ